MANRFDTGRPGEPRRRDRRDFAAGYADDRDRERLQEILNRPGFGRMGDDRDYLDDSDDAGSDRARAYGEASRSPTRRARGAFDESPRIAEPLREDSRAGMESLYARNRVAGSYGRPDDEPRRSAGGDIDARRQGRRDSGAVPDTGRELGDSGTFGSGNHVLADDFSTRDPRGERIGWPDASDYDGHGGSMRARGGADRRTERSNGWSDGDYRDFTPGGLRRQEAFREPSGIRHVDRDEPDGRHGWMERAAGEVASWSVERNDRSVREPSAGRGMTGRGPRGYVRPDDRIREDVNDRLTDDDYLDATEIEVAVDAGVVTLSGTVEDRWAKRRAEEVAERVRGVTDVLNRIRLEGSISPTSTDRSAERGGSGSPLS
jgi:hypothetical protein